MNTLGKNSNLAVKLKHSPTSPTTKKMALQRWISEKKLKKNSNLGLNSKEKDIWKIELLKLSKVDIFIP